MRLIMETAVVPLTLDSTTRLFRHLPYFRGKWREIIRSRNTIFEYFDRIIETHQAEMGQQLVVEDEPSDFIYAYLQAMDLRPENPHYTQQQLRNVVLDLFIAGLETTAHTLAFAVLYVLHNPRVQARIHEELDQLTGGDRDYVVKWADRVSLPYMQAVINVGAGFHYP